MVKPKFRRTKSRIVTIPGIPVYKARNRPVQLDEDKLALSPQGVHRPLSEAGFGTGGGEWGYHAANASRPKFISAQVDHEDTMQRRAFLNEVEGWVRDCAEDVLDVAGPGKIIRSGPLAGRRVAIKVLSASAERRIVMCDGRTVIY